MRGMGIYAICPGPNLSRRAQKSQVFPYLLRSLAVGHSNQVWSIDITYLRLPGGWIYLVTVRDWYSRLPAHFFAKSVRPVINYRTLGEFIRTVRPTPAVLLERMPNTWLSATLPGVTVITVLSSPPASMTIRSLPLDKLTPLSTPRGGIDTKCCDRVRPLPAAIRQTTRGRRSYGA